MSGFSNSIIGGMSKLIRAAIQSPNYSPGVSGWSINKNGTAEFNNLTVRGTVAMTPIAQGTLGNLYWIDGYTHPAQIYEDSGLHSLILRPPSNGNVYTKILLLNDDNPLNGRGQFYAFDDSLGHAISADVTLNDNGLQVIPKPAGSPRLNLGRVNATDTTLTRHSFNADYGAFYREAFTIPAGTNYPNNTLTPVVGSVPTPLTVLESQTDYGSQMALGTGVWTCPENGWYLLTFVLFLNLNVAAFRMVLTFIDGSGNRLLYQDITTIGGNMTLSGMVYIGATVTVTPSVFQVQGAAHAVSAAAGLTSQVSFARVAA